MHPEHVQMSGSMGLQGERKIKHQEVLEEEIDVLEVDNGGVNGDSIEDHKGNGLPHKENGHSYPNDKDKIEESGEDKMAADANSQNGSETKPVLRLKTPRRNSTSSRSSSVSSALSVKQQTPMALQMEVSLDEEEREHLEPLIIGGTAEDLEVSLSVSHDDGDEEATTDTETVKYDVMEIANDPYEFDEETGSDHDSEVVINKKSSSAKPSKAAKQSSKAKDDTKPGKPKASRKKSLKLKETSSMPCEFDSNLEETDAENSDTYSISKEDTEFEDSSVKLLKSPKRSKPSSTKLYLIDEAETEEKNSEPELAPRRSSRSRQTPQKYNSSVYVDSFWDHPAQSEDRMNNSDAALGGSIRSVKGRRSLRKSRNMSSLNTSLHNESSPWENELKVLTPSGGCLSIHRVEEVVDSSTPSKRKAVHDDEDDVDNLVERGQKKMCIENIDLDTSTSSQTSSFFSIITSPITLLKNRLRGSSVSCSTPVSKGSHFISVEPGAPCNNSNNADDNSSNEVAVETEAKAAPEAQKWCSIM